MEAHRGLELGLNHYHLPSSLLHHREAAGPEKTPSTFQALIIKNLHLVSISGEGGYRAGARGWGEIRYNN